MYSNDTSIDFFYNFKVTFKYIRENIQKLTISPISDPVKMLSECFWKSFRKAKKIGYHK